MAAHLLLMTAQALGTAQRAGELIEVDCDAKNQVSDPRRCPRHGQGVAQGGRDGSGHDA